MGKAFELVQVLWIEAQLRAPFFVERTVMSCLHEAKEIARLLVKPYLPVYQLQGQGHNGPLSVNYVGLQFSKTVLKNNLFVEQPTERLVGQIPFWRYDELADLPSGDITIVETAEHLVRKLPRRNAVVWARSVHHIVDVRGDWQDVRNRFHKSVRRNELRWIRKYGYEYDVSQDDRDFEKFYYRMYLPTMAGRHGELARPLPIGEAYRYFRHGLLFRVKRDGDWVSGAVCYPQQGVLIAKISGTTSADEQLIHEGATAATYYASIHWANQNGYRAVNFLGSSARLESGLFQHKRKWGSTVSIPPHLHRQVWIQFRRITPAVYQFLTEKHLIVVDGDDKLHGLIVVDDPHNVPAETREEWERQYATPGLSSLIIRSIESFAGDLVDDGNTDLVIPIPSNSGLRDR